MLPRCPPGQRRNRISGLCEACPPGFIRQGRRCVAGAIAPVVPVGQVGPVAPVPILWPAKPTRCPRSYTRSKHVPYSCEKCPANTKKNNRTRMCDPVQPIRLPLRASDVRQTPGEIIERVIVRGVLRELGDTAIGAIKSLRLRARLLPLLLLLLPLLLLLLPLHRPDLQLTRPLLHRGYAPTSQRPCLLRTGLYYRGRQLYLEI